MQYRMTSRRRKPRSNTAPQQSGKQTPRLPHERDESADSQQTDESATQPTARATREDVERGVVDTDRSPVMNETYERLRGNDDPEKKFSP